MSEERTYTVDGMTCGHCKAAVEAEIRALQGIDDVEVDLERGRVTVRGEVVDDQAVAAAVDEAGYAVRV
jgi:copper chaperone CopZ